MAKMEYGWLKIRFGAQKYKKVIIALLCGFVFMALIYYGVRGMIPQMSVEVALAHYWVQLSVAFSRYLVQWVLLKCNKELKKKF